ncbi:helix-turn-helix transcriptional regulator [Fructilactobacillus frigidiflavus]|uniref:helix-turn-helix transcriptional regulator n=1 Tax=Fructilactobacillus frigidiflavus TaxID=3242688 RepID=UPI003756D9FC
METINLGTTIKVQRKKQHLSQKELATDICTQPMISAIENNKYIPNGIILMKILQRLNVSLNEINLDGNFSISSKHEVNQQMENFCNTHQYQKLYQLLISEETQNLIDNDLQTQAYYYYLAIAILQTTGDLSKAIRNLKLSLAAKTNSEKSELLIRLVKVSLAYIASLQNQPNKMNNYIDEALTGMKDLRFNKDQIVIYYLAALSKYELKDYLTTITLIDKLISFATEYNSHYMLANAYYLLALAAAKTDQTVLFKEAQAREKMLSSLFGEKIFKKI